MPDEPEHDDVPLEDCEPSRCPTCGCLGAMCFCQFEDCEFDEEAYKGML